MECSRDSGLSFCLNLRRARPKKTQKSEKVNFWQPRDVLSEHRRRAYRVSATPRSQSVIWHVSQTRKFRICAKKRSRRLGQREVGSQQVQKGATKRRQIRTRILMGPEEGEPPRRLPKRLGKSQTVVVTWNRFWGM